jgi:hypothetical protein
VSAPEGRIVIALLLRATALTTIGWPEFTEALGKRTVIGFGIESTRTTSPATAVVLVDWVVVGE